MTVTFVRLRNHYCPKCKRNVSSAELTETFKHSDCGMTKTEWREVYLAMRADGDTKGSLVQQDEPCGTMP